MPSNLTYRYNLLGSEAMTSVLLQLVCAHRPTRDLPIGLSDALVLMNCDDESATQHLTDRARS